MTDARAYLDQAIAALASTLDATREWPGDLDESASHWADLMKRLGELAHWAVQAAVVVRDDAEELPGDSGHTLALQADLLVSALNATTTNRSIVDHKWRGVATTFTHARRNMPDTGRAPIHEATFLADPVRHAAEAVRKAANQRLAVGDVVAVLNKASGVCTQMCGLATRIAAALERRPEACPEPTGICRALRGRIHDAYKDSGDQFDTAAGITADIIKRWPGRWPDSV